MPHALAEQFDLHDALVGVGRDRRGQHSQFLGAHAEERHEPEGQATAGMDLHHAADLADGIDPAAVAPGEFKDVAGEFDAGDGSRYFDEMTDPEIGGRLERSHDPILTAPSRRSSVTPLKVHHLCSAPGAGG